MACLPKFTASQLTGCGPTVSRLSRPVSAKVINSSDISSFTISQTSTATITRAAGAPASASLECSNGATVITAGVKGGEVAPQMADITIQTKIFNTGLSTSPTGAALTSGGVNSSVVIAVDHGGIFRVYGLGYPLDCLSLEGDSEGDGFYTVTFGVEDWKPGTTVYGISEADYKALSEAVAGGGGAA